MPPVTSAITAKRLRMPDVRPRKPATRMPRPKTAAALAHTTALPEPPRLMMFAASRALSPPPTSRADPVAMATAGAPGPDGRGFGGRGGTHGVGYPASPGMPLPGPPGEVPALPTPPVPTPPAPTPAPPTPPAAGTLPAGL